MTWRVGIVNYPEQFRRQERDLMRIVHDVLSHGDLMLRHQLIEFEEHLAEFVGTRYAVGVSNCTDALRLACHALSFGPGDEVATVAHTFVATISPFKLAGCEPVLVDIAADHTMDPQHLNQVVSERTRVIIPVHLNGRTCDMDSIIATAKSIGAEVIEDAAQALGATYKGQRAGTFGSCAVYSFYPAKILGALGDAGALVTDDEGLANEIRMLRDHGRTGKATYGSWGYNSRLDNLQAAILDYRLGLLPAWIDRRRELANRYDEGLRDVQDITLPPGPTCSEDRFDVYQNYAILSSQRDQLVEELSAAGIETLISWPIPLHKQEALALADLSLPMTEHVSRSVVSLPLYPELSDENVDYVCQRITQFAG